MPRKLPAAIGFDRFWQSLDDQARCEFAERAKSTVGYIGGAVLYAHKMPRVETIENIAAACNESGFYTSPEDLLVWLYRRRRARITAARRPRSRRVVRLEAANVG